MPFGRFGLGPGFSAGSGGTPAPVLPLRVATVQNRIQSLTATHTGYDRFAVYIDHIVGHDLQDIVLNHNGWVMGNSGESNLANAYTILEAAVIANGTAVQIFHDGSASKTVNPGDNDVCADAIPASSFGLSYIPRGSIIRTKIVYGYALGGVLPYTVRDIRAVAGQQAVRFNSSNTTPSTAVATGVFTFTGTAPNSQNFMICPIVLGRPVSDGATFVAIGDSLTEGVGEYTGTTSNGAAGHGWLQRAMHGAASPTTDPIACINFARSGNDTTDYSGASNTKWREYIKYGKYIINGLGANDIGASASGSDTTYMLSVEAAINAVFAQYTDELPIRYKLTPRVNSTDGWTTLSGQTPTGTGWDEGGIADLFNDYVASNVGTLYRHQLSCDSFLSSPGAWTVAYPIANGGTASGVVMNDNTHFNGVGGELIASDNRAYFAGLT